MTTTTDALRGAELSPQHLRSALGLFASGVTIVTTAEGATDDSVHGMTANAFVSVSLDPPLVLVSVSAKAKMNQKITDTGRYGVSVLAHSQLPLSLHFAGAAQHPDLVKFVWREGVPLVAGALVHLACDIVDSHVAGDHFLHVGRVRELWYDDGMPLVFYSGGFRSLQQD